VTSVNHLTSSIAAGHVASCGAVLVVAGAEDAAHSIRLVFAGRHVDGTTSARGARHAERTRTHDSSRSAKHALY
jgi:hypothetical protein